MKKISSSILLSCAFFMPLTGCQTIQDGVGVLGVGGDNKYDMKYLKANLKVGVTTSEQVIELFGKPSYQVNGSNGPTYFSYDEGVTASGNLIGSAMSSIGFGNIAGTVQSVKEGKKRDLHIHFRNNKVSNFEVEELQAR